MTTIPSRLKDVNKTIKSIQNQTLKPNKIFLNIPKEYYRFPNTKIDENVLESINSDFVEITRCKDYGPATKIMGSINKLKEYDCLIIIDDDHLYHNKMCEIFVNEFKKNKINYSFYVQKIFDLKMAQCADGFLINCKYLDGINDFYKEYVVNNKNMFLDDDLWLSIYLQKVKNSNIENLITIFKKKTLKNVIYDIHSSIDALSHNIHNPKKILNRRKIAKIEYLKFKFKKFIKKFIN